MSLFLIPSISFSFPYFLSQLFLFSLSFCLSSFSFSVSISFLCLSFSPSLIILYISYLLFLISIFHTLLSFWLIFLFNRIIAVSPYASFCLLSFIRPIPPFLPLFIFCVCVQFFFLEGLIYLSPESVVWQWTWKTLWIFQPYISVNGNALLYWR